MTTDRAGPPAGKLTLPDARIAVISPHLDDAVLSLGATINAAVAIGTQVVVLTAFGGDPDSILPAGQWDRSCGFTTEGEAVRQRRLEDRKACSILGATPAWLPFGDEQYLHYGDRANVVDALAAMVAGHDVLLIPGFPLVNPDHAWLSRALLSRAWPGKRVGLYAEQPYVHQARRSARQLVAAALLEDLLPASPVWFRLPIAAEHRRAKRAAVLAYQSQLSLLHLGRLGLSNMLRQEALAGGEGLAWIV